MATTGKIQVEVELKSPADKIWAATRDSVNLFPKAFPNQYKSIEVLEGDGKSVGSIRLVKYTEEGTPEITFSKEKIEAVDEGNKTVTYSVIEGDLLKYYKVFRPTLVVSAKGDGSVVKWICEFEKTSQEIPNPDIIKEFAVKNFQELDAYLLKA